MSFMTQYFDQEDYFMRVIYSVVCLVTKDARKESKSEIAMIVEMIRQVFGIDNRTSDDIIVRHYRANNGMTLHLENFHKLPVRYRQIVFFWAMNVVFSDDVVTETQLYTLSIIGGVLYIPKKVIDQIFVQIRSTGSSTSIDKNRSKDQADIDFAYETLGLRPGSPAKIVKETYRTIAIKNHPDRAEEAYRKESDEKFKAIRNAYKILQEKVYRSI